MSAPNLWIVDSFTDRAFHGNPAGVHRCDQLPSANSMQNIASELNLSETAFTCPLGATNCPGNETGIYAIRYYSPKKEIPLCGHATLAAAQILFEQSELEQLTFHTASDLRLSVRRTGLQIEMQFPVYSLVDATPPPALLAALGLSSVRFSGFNAETQILMLEIESASKLLDLEPNFSALLESCDSINDTPLHGVSVTARAGDQFDFHSRFFWPWSGGNEDPVTGGTHTFLAKYWAEKLGKSVMRSFQASPRTGQMEVELKSHGTLLIRGKAVVILEGNLRRELDNA